jgi:hypothetical protein
MIDAVVTAMAISPSSRMLAPIVDGKAKLLIDQWLDISATVIMVNI